MGSVIVSATPASAKPSTQPATGKRTLVLIEAPEDVALIVSALTSEASRGDASSVVLLNIQPQPDPVATRGLFAHEIRSRLEMVGRQLLAPAAEALTRAGLACENRVELAHGAADAIACAHELDCDRIVVVAPPMGTARRIWMKATGCAASNLASRVAVLSDIPVLVLQRRSQ